MCGGHSQRTAWRGGTGKPSTSCPDRRSWERRLCWDTARRGGSDTPCCEGGKKKAQKKIKRRDKTLWPDSASPHYSFTFLTLWLNLRIFHKFVHINMHPCSLQAPLVFQRRSFWNVCCKLYIIISPSLSHKMSSQSVRLRFFLLLFLSIWLNCFKFKEIWSSRTGLNSQIPIMPCAAAEEIYNMITWSPAEWYPEDRQDCRRRETGGVVSPTTQTYWDSFCVNFAAFAQRADAKKHVKKTKLRCLLPSDENSDRVWPISYHNIVPFFFSFVFFFFFFP